MPQIAGERRILDAGGLQHLLDSLILGDAVALRVEEEVVVLFAPGGERLQIGLYPGIEVMLAVEGVQ